MFTGSNRNRSGGTAFPSPSAPARAGFGLVAIVAATACGGGQARLPDVSTVYADTATLVERGEYIVRTVSVCGGCHSADEAQPDGPLSGGRAFKDWRLGTIRASNITADPYTGIGSWTDAEIIRAIRNGQTKYGKLIAPVMPYHWFNKMGDRDALAVARYLKTQKPVRQLVLDRPSYFYRIGDMLFMGPIKHSSGDPPPRGPTVEYGRYLSRNVALCADCHTRRSGLMSEAEMDRLFAGTNHPPKGFPVNPANITPDSSTGIGRWSEADFLKTMRTGVNPNGVQLNPFMPWPQYKRMTDDDLRAIYRYLQTVQPIRNQVIRASYENR